MFGHKHENFGKGKRYWGARAIYASRPRLLRQDYDIDLLWDRQSTDGVEDDAESQEFVNWLNGRALPWLRAKVKEIGLAIDDPQELVLHEFKYELRASTHGSHGYLYIGAVEHELIEGEPRKNSVTGDDERVVEAGGVKFVVDKEVAIGTEGTVNVNGIGPGKVVGYYNENYGDDCKLACLQVELHDPPEWWINQRQRDELEKLVKAGQFPAKRGTDPQHGIPSPTKAKEWKQNWKPSPCIMWANDFKEAVEV